MKGIITLSQPPNPQPPVETPPPPPPNPNPPVETPPPSPGFNPSEFMTELDTKMTAWSERVTNSVREAITIPTPPPPPNPPKNDPPDPPKNDPPDPPKNDPPVPGRKSFVEWWFGK